jgi:polyphosphate kinase 2 (PPK2 family)
MFWKQYMDVHEECLSATTSKTAPWYIVPADDKYNARLIVAKTIADTLEDLKMTYPEATEQHRQELQSIRKLLEK